MSSKSINNKNYFHHTITIQIKGLLVLQELCIIASITSFPWEWGALSSHHFPSFSLLLSVSIPSPRLFPSLFSHLSSSPPFLLLFPFAISSASAQSSSLAGSLLRSARGGLLVVRLSFKSTQLARAAPPLFFSLPLSPFFFALISTNPHYNLFINPSYSLPSLLFIIHSSLTVQHTQNNTSDGRRDIPDTKTQRGEEQRGPPRGGESCQNMIFPSALISLR